MLFLDIGPYNFRAFPWSLYANIEEILVILCTRRVTIKSVPPFLWNILPKTLEMFGKVIIMIDSSTFLPYLDARILIAINPKIDILEVLRIDMEDEFSSFPTEILGSLNACFLFHREFHEDKIVCC